MKFVQTLSLCVVTLACLAALPVHADTMMPDDAMGMKKTTDSSMDKAAAMTSSASQSKDKMMDKAMTGKSDAVMKADTMKKDVPNAMTPDSAAMMSK